MNHHCSVRSLDAGAALVIAEVLVGIGVLDFGPVTQRLHGVTLFGSGERMSCNGLSGYAFQHYHFEAGLVRYGGVEREGLKARGGYDCVRFHRSVLLSEIEINRTARARPSSPTSTSARAAAPASEVAIENPWAIRAATGSSMRTISPRSHGANGCV